MADILTIADARKALRLAATDASNDTDLTNVYVPAVTTVCEDIAGPIMAVSRTYTVDGGKSAVALPSVVQNAASVTAVTEFGATLTAGSDYVVDARAGLIYRGTIRSQYVFLPGYQNVSVTYTAGYAATTTDVTAAHKLAARIILRHLWQADQQGTGAGRQIGGVAVDMETVTTLSGFLVPKRAYELLRPTSKVPGFA